MTNPYIIPAAAGAIIIGLTGIVCAQQTRLNKTRKTLKAVKNVCGDCFAYCLSKPFRLNSAQIAELYSSFYFALSDIVHDM